MSYTFVPYHKKHLKSCVRLVRETWNLHKGFKNIKNIDLVYLSYFNACIHYSKHSELVLDKNDNVVGIMLGSIEKGDFLSSLKSVLASFFSSASSFFWLIKGDFGHRRTAIKNMRAMYEINSMGESHSHEFDSEVNLFLVSKHHRGKKLGYILMNNYIDFCRRSNLKNCFLWTDLGCTYTFYDRYGFKLLEKFHHKGLTHGDKSSPNGMIYYLNIKE